MSNIRIERLALLIEIGTQALRGIKADTESHLDLQRVIEYFEVLSEGLSK